MADFRAEIGELWHQVNREIHERMHQAFRGGDLPPPMAMVMMRTIGFFPGITVSELARKVGTVKSHTSKLVDQLVTQGYIEKRSDPADQRLLRLYPTECASKNMGEMQARARKLWGEVIQEVPEDQLEDVVRGFVVLLSALKKSNANTTKD